MIDYLTSFWILFLLLWLVILIIRVWANYKIYKNKPKPLIPVLKERSGFEIFIISLFTLYNRPFPLDENNLKKLKIRSNILHLFFIYGLIGACFFTTVVLISYIENTSSNQQTYRNDGPETDIIENPQSEYGYDFNNYRKEKGLIPLPSNFRMSNNSNSYSEIWKHNNPSRLEYYHEMKYVYLDNGEWIGEYDIFVHKRSNQTDETLNVDFSMQNDTLVAKYRRDTEIISRQAFIDGLTEWGLQTEIE